MTDHVDMGCLGVGEHRFHEGPYLEDVLLGVIVLGGSIGISWTPGSCVKFRFLVALISKESGKGSEASLPGDVSVL